MAANAHVSFCLKFMISPADIHKYWIGEAASYQWVSQVRKRHTPMSTFLCRQRAYTLRAK
jgi:hypothetical protein